MKAYKNLYDPDKLDYTKLPDEIVQKEIDDNKVIIQNNVKEKKYLLQQRKIQS